MRARTLNLWQNLQGSYYFIPGLMGIAAIALSFITVAVDAKFLEFFRGNQYFFYENPAGARTILATIAGSMIGVAATTFSITMVAVTSAANQYGPRLIGNFMRDRGNQWVLGTFTATFLYSLLILRAVRDGDNSQMVAQFVPGLSLSIALLMTVVAVGVLIYFIHHVPETLNVGNLTAKVGQALKRDIEDTYCVKTEPKKSDENLHRAELFQGDQISICADIEGFIQTLDMTSLINAAQKVEGIVEVKKQPGSFVTDGDILAFIWGASKWDEKCENAFLRAYVTGPDRTSHQNILFLADELIEILARAVSPGINDPYTAINCIHWLKSGLKALEKAEVPSPFVRDSADKVRVVFEHMDFEEFFSTIMERSLPYVRTDDNVLRAMVDCLEELDAATTKQRNKALIKSTLLAIKESSATAPDMR